MTTIRSNPFPQQTPQRPMGQDASKVAAQRAFFEALGKAQAPVQAGPAQAAAPPTAPHQAAATPQRNVASGDVEQPQRILRPGSLIDIRV